MTGALLLALTCLPAAAQTPPFTDSFAQQDGLIANEYGYRNPTSTDAVRSADWDVPSGSLFVQRGIAFTGVPDGTPANARSTNGTHSAVFRLLTSRGDFGDVDVTFQLLNEGLTASDVTPAVPWDGCHVALRYRDEGQFYYASVNRRDETAVIKKKSGETFYDLTETIPAAVPFNLWQKVRVSVKDNPDGSVWIALWRDNKLLAQALDAGAAGGPAYRGVGKVGLRGDNARLRFGHFHVDAIAAPGAAALPPQVLGVTPTNVTADSATLLWSTDQEALERVEYGPTAGYGLEVPWRTSQGSRSHAVTLTGLLPATQYHVRVWARGRGGAEGSSGDVTFTTRLTSDLAAPSVVIVSPQQGQTLAGTVALVCNAVDDVAVAGVQWQLDGSDLGPEATAAPFSYVWNSSQSANGPHRLTATARDAAGHRTLSAPVTITITGGR
jgi:hypothetical protein